MLWVAEFLSTTLELSFEEELPERRVEYVTGLLMQNTSMVSLDRGSAGKVDDVTALPCRADDVTASHIQDGG